MEISISSLLDQKSSLISALSKKFHISIEGAKEFLKLSIIQRAKTNYKIQTSENSLNGSPDLLKKLKMISSIGLLTISMRMISKLLPTAKISVNSRAILEIKNV